MLHQLEGDDVVATAIVAGSRPGAILPGYVGMAAPPTPWPRAECCWPHSQ
ncbi:MAG: hypothetical protein K0Q71_973 [Thermomicrobiales bacterium]|nr:hypothetical protein [Thermomicrobiales bacterium]